MLIEKKELLSRSANRKNSGLSKSKFIKNEKNDTAHVSP